MGVRVNPGVVTAGRGLGLSPNIPNLRPPNPYAPQRQRPPSSERTLDPTGSDHYQPWPSPRALPPQPARPWHAHPDPLAASLYCAGLHTPRPPWLRLRLRPPSRRLPYPGHGPPRPAGGPPRARGSHRAVGAEQAARQALTIQPLPAH